MKPKFQELYMDWADRTARLSHAKRLQVGAVIVKDDSVISYGYNGMPAGWDNNCEEKIFMPPDVGLWLSQEEIDEKWPLEEEIEDNGNKYLGRYHLKTRPEVLHAESNAIAKLAKSTNSGVGADIFITHAPCIHCSKLIYQSGIKRVFYKFAYRDESGVRFLKNSDIEVIHLL